MREAKMPIESKCPKCGSFRVLKSNDWIIRDWARLDYFCRACGQQFGYVGVVSVVYDYEHPVLIKDYDE
jgi:DNA-directed RNA polymerase subunit RPC12/RpoP